MTGPASVLRRPAGRLAADGPRPPGPRATPILVILLLVALVGLSGCRSGSSAGTGSTAAAGASGSSAGTQAGGSGQGQELAPSQPTTDLPVVAVAKLPPQAVDTLELIRAGGPYPYSKDGATFSNNERILPAQPKGFYAEYTVITPGSSDRGARRIVAGDDGSRFYTSDHYASFREVVAR